MAVKTRSPILPFVAGAAAALLAVSVVGWVISAVFWLVKAALVLLVIFVVATLLGRLVFSRR